MSKPINYACWTPILLHLDANIRIQISLHCPQLQTLNRLCPTKIKKLVVNLPCFEIDGVTYSPEVNWPSGWDRETKDKAHTKIEHTREEVKELEKSLESADDQQTVKDRIKCLQSSIKSLVGKLEFGPDPVYQIIAYGKNQRKMILGTAERTIESMDDVEGYLIRKWFCGNYLIDVAVLNPTFVMNRVENFWDISIIANARHLSLNMQIDRTSFVALPNSNVYCDYYELTNELSEMLITDWQKRSHPVGRKYGWRLTYEPDVRERFEYISSLPGARTGTIAKTRETDFPLAVTFHMSAETELNAYCVMDDKEFRNFTVFHFFFEVHPKGYAAHF